MCYSVLPCSDRDTIVVLPSLTLEKVGLPGRHDVNPWCKPWVCFDSTFCTLERNRNFSLNGNLQLKYETKTKNYYNSYVTWNYHTWSILIIYLIQLKILFGFAYRLVDAEYSRRIFYFSKVLHFFTKNPLQRTLNV